MATPEILLIDDGCTIAMQGNAFVAFTGTASTMARLREIRRYAAQHTNRWKNDTRSVSVILPGIPMTVSEEVRAEVAALTKEFSSLATAMVIEGDGFAPATMRTLMAGIYLIVRPKNPHKIFSQCDDAVRWLLATTATTSKVPMTPQELEGAIVGARMKLASAMRVA